MIQTSIVGHDCSDFVPTGDCVLSLLRVVVVPFGSPGVVGAIHRRCLHLHHEHEIIVAASCFPEVECVRLSQQVLDLSQQVLAVGF